MRACPDSRLGMLLACIMFLAGGCGDSGVGPPAGQSEIYGVVKNKGRAVGSIGNNLHYMIFEPVEGTPPAGAELKYQLPEDGNFSYALPVGEYNVRVVDSRSKGVGSPVRVSAKEPLQSVDIDVTPKGP